MTRWLRLRWALDRAVAIVLAFVVAPLALAVWATVRFKDGAPTMVRLPRVGRGGVEFPIVKFRTMRPTGTDGLSAGPALTIGGDSRVTEVGRRLRHYRLDELPQLANVARGDMSLLGPRPEAPDFVDLEDVRWQGVLRARPGIAGPTQVIIHDLEAAIGLEDIGRYESEILPIKLAVDRWYVESASPLIDLIVVSSLVERFLFRRLFTTAHRLLVREIPEVAEFLALHGRTDAGRDCG